MLKVKSAIPIMASPLSAKTHQLIFVRKGNCFNQEYNAQQAGGVAMTNASTTSLRKSFDSVDTICVTVAPNTFLTPISLMRRLVV